MALRYITCNCKATNRVGIQGDGKLSRAKDKHSETQKMNISRMHAHILSKIYTHKHEKTLKYELRNGYSKPFCISESSDNFGKISPDWLYIFIKLIL